MKLSDLLSEKYIISNLKSRHKEDVINELIDLFRGDDKVNDIEKVRASVMDREKIMSTGVGKNFAIPHGKTDAVNDIICAFGRTNEPIDYQSLDSQPVHLVFLIVGKDTMVSTHIKLLSRISRMMTKDGFREKLLKETTVEGIIKHFREEEANYFEL
ncbi:MAG: PTS sugar transporter subunit IIA [Ignavibacteriaceae bacterium]|nr:PTS sugar transporter subunit IIA [Ignavibacteriaceae bacterium]